MAGTSIPVEGSPKTEYVRVYYTGTSVAGVAIAADLLPGYTIFKVPDSALPTGAAAPAATRAETAILDRGGYIVAEVPEGSKRGGEVYCYAKATKIADVLVEGTTDIAVGDKLGGTNGQWYLVKTTSGFPTAVAVADEAFTTNGTGNIDVQMI